MRFSGIANASAPTTNVKMIGHAKRMTQFDGNFIQASKTARSISPGDEAKRARPTSFARDACTRIFAKSRRLLRCDKRGRLVTGQFSASETANTANSELAQISMSSQHSRRSVRAEPFTAPWPALNHFRLQ